MKREVLTSFDTPTPMAHYCQGILAGETVYAAGQIASDYKTGVPPEARQDPAFPHYGSDIQKQTRYVLNNLRSVFQAAGCDLKDTVKSQVFLTDLNDFYYFDQVWKKYSDLDDSIPVNERSYEAKQPGASWITRPGYSFFSAIWRWTGLPAWSCWNTGKLW